MATEITEFEIDQDVGVGTATVKTNRKGMHPNAYRDEILSAWFASGSRRDYGLRRIHITPEDLSTLSKEGKAEFEVSD
jgi:hypothetical protein